jgi:hypothetical protein
VCLLLPCTKPLHTGWHTAPTPASAALPSEHNQLLLLLLLLVVLLLLQDSLLWSG